MKALIAGSRGWSGSRGIALFSAGIALISLAVRKTNAQEPPEAGVEPDVPEADAPGPLPLDKQAEPSVLESLRDSLFGGRPYLNLRLRAEVVEQDGLDTAQAYTERLRLGYGTKPFHGLSLYVEFEDIRAADDDLYNAAGLNGQPDKAVVADPNDTELNQLFARYESDVAAGTVGRQRITLDDHRFVGNVGWRQNEQTFDAATIVSSWAPDTRVYYGYVDDVNRIFGPDADLDFESDSHLVNIAYTGCPAGTLTGFAYLLDFPNSALNSSNTVGLRFAGSHSLPAGLSLGYAASYAYQADGGPNPIDYEASYYFVEVSLGKKGLGTVGAGYEVLGSDDGDFAFRTPLATLHKFNGWADVFLTTPNAGLQDLYFFAGPELPYGIKTQVVYHLFFSEEGKSDLGGELDAVAGKAITENISVLGKLAIFDGQEGLADVQKYWLEVEISF